MEDRKDRRDSRDRGIRGTGRGITEMSFWDGDKI